MKKELIKILMCLTVVSTAQTFTHSLSILARQSGLQALAVTPDLKNLAATGFNDVRIYDKNKNEVPYFLVNESFNYFSGNFKEYEISDKEVGKGHYTSLTILNHAKRPMQNIVLCTMNSDAVKICDIVGSDDKKQWFSVSDHIWMYNLYDEGSVNAYRTLSFPMVNYKYLKLEINDLHTKPLNIIKAGYFEGAISAGKLNEVKPLAENYTTIKSKKVSVNTVKFEHSTIINKINFKVKSPNYFKRSARILVNKTRKIKGRQESYKEPALEFELNSNQANSFDLNNFREKEFEIEIDNADNPPLEFEKIEYAQLQTYLVADFKQGEEYDLFAGNKSLNVPNYDIEYFRDKISQYVPTVEVSELKPIPVSKAEPVVITQKKMWQEPWFMWACIALASFTLFLFSIRILKDLKK